MSVKLLTELNLEFLSLNEGCTGSSESTLVEMPHCWKSHVVAHMYELTHGPINKMTCAVATDAILRPVIQSVKKYV